MKVRLEDQRIVFRLNDESRANLKFQKDVKTIVDFGNGGLSFQIVLNSDVSSIGMTFNNNEVVVEMPESYMDVWDKVKIGFEEDVELANGKVINLIIEKDLKRSKKRDS